MPVDSEKMHDCLQSGEGPVKVEGNHLEKIHHVCILCSWSKVLTWVDIDLDSNFFGCSMEIGCFVNKKWIRLN